MSLLQACNDAQPPLAPLSETAVVLAFGDSLTAGNGAGPQSSYPSVLAQRTGLNIINAGVPGELSGQGLDRLPELLALHAPDLLLLCHGGNDLLRKHPEQRIRDNLRAMIELARSHGTDVMLIGVPRPALLGLDSAPLYKELAAEFAIPIEPRVLPEILGDRSLKADQIHPNAAGYRVLAEAVQGVLEASGALGPP